MTPFYALQQNSDKYTGQSDSEVQIDDECYAKIYESSMLAESDVEYSLDASSRISLSLPHPINQIKMNDLISDLNLSKDQSQVLAS